jgi:hypothetical protein
MRKVPRPTEFKPKRALEPRIKRLSGFDWRELSRPLRWSVFFTWVSLTTTRNATVGALLVCFLVLSDDETVAHSSIHLHSHRSVFRQWSLKMLS